MGQGLWARAAARVLRIVEPSPRIEGGADRRRARAALAILAILAATTGFDLVLSVLRLNGANPPNIPISAAASLVLLLALVVARRGRVEQGVLIGIVAMDTAVLGWRLVYGGTDESPLYALAVPILTGGLLLRPRNAVRATAAVVLAFAAEYYVDRTVGLPLNPGDVILVLLLVLVAAVAIVASGLAAADARALEEQATTLETARRALAEAATERQRMFNQVAHDLAQPLQPLSIQAFLLAQQPPGTDVRASIAVITRSVGQLKRQVEDLNDLVRVESRGMRLARAHLDLRQAAESAAASFRPLAAAKGVTLATAGGPTWVDADPARIDQVLNNLLSNAVKFTPRGGEVRITTRMEGATAVLAVADTGRGLAPDEIPRLFRPFTQVHRPEEVVERGTGLGLVIARGIAEAHGGTVTVASEGLRRGSVFELHLPLGPAPTPAM